MLRRSLTEAGGTTERRVWLLLGAILATRIALSAYMVGRPGLQQDETLFVNAATLRVPGVNMPHAINGVPLMIFPYIGALKSWLYAPLFTLFGTSAATIRLPAVVIVCIGLALLYAGVRELVNRLVATFAVMVLAFDNSIFWLTRDDVGPSAIEFFLKCACMFCVARLVRAGSRQTRWLLLLLTALAFGVFNKLNFIWVVNAVAVISLVVVMVDRRSARMKAGLIAVWVLGLAAIYAGFAGYYFHQHIGTLSPVKHGDLLSYTWPRFEAGMRAVLSGTWFYGYALSPLPPRDAVAGVALVLFILGAFASVVPRSTRNAPVSYTALATLLVAIQNALTAQATAGWHYIAIYPFVTVVAAYGVYGTARLVLGSKRPATIVLACMTAAALTYNAILMAKYVRALHAEPRNPAWSAAIYRLSDYLEGQNATVYTADWGIFNPLFALHPERRFKELAFTLRNPPSAAYLTRLGRSIAATPGAKIVVAHANGKLVFKRSSANLFTALGRHLTPLRAIDGQDGKPVYELFAYR